MFELFPATTELCTLSMLTGYSLTWHISAATIPKHYLPRLLLTVLLDINTACQTHLSWFNVAKHIPQYCIYWGAKSNTKINIVASLHGVFDMALSLTSVCHTVNKKKKPADSYLKFSFKYLWPLCCITATAGYFCSINIFFFFDKRGKGLQLLIL